MFSPEYQLTVTNEAEPEKRQNAFEIRWYILVALLENPAHGYAISKRVSELSNGSVRLSAGTLYENLRTLLQEGSLQQLPDVGRKKPYQITEEGKRYLGEQVAKLNKMTQAYIEVTKGNL